MQRAKYFLYSFNKHRCNKVALCIFTFLKRNFHLRQKFLFNGELQDSHLLEKLIILKGSVSRFRSISLVYSYISGPLGFRFLNPSLETFFLCNKRNQRRSVEERDDNIGSIRFFHHFLCNLSFLRANEEEILVQLVKKFFFKS